MLARPVPSEYDEYYRQYVSKVPQGNIFEIIEGQIGDTVRFLATIGEEKAAYRYGPGKWSIKQVIGHVNDVERLFQYRAMAFARKDRTPLPSFDQNDYVDNSNFDDRTIASLTEEYRGVRSSGLAMFKSFDDDISMRKGIATGLEFSVRSIPFILAGHNIHHISVIKERYL
jgi:hypothetical protein